MEHGRMGVGDFINVPEDKRARILPDGTEETGIVGIRTDEGTFAADGTLISENPNRQPSLFDAQNEAVGARGLARILSVFRSFGRRK